MKVVNKITAIGIFLCLHVLTFAQVNYEFGIWQSAGQNLSVDYYPQIRGRLINFKWKDIETKNNKWDWSKFDADLKKATEDKLPIIFMVFTKEDAPDWLYQNGVDKVIEKDNNGRVTGHSPYYADPDYKRFFKRMIEKVSEHVDKMEPNIRNYIIGVQACFGSTGDYISYKGNVDQKYYLSSYQFYELFTEFTMYYFNAYKNTNPKITLLSNPHNNGSDQSEWLVQNCPGTWIKTGSIGKGYQLNDEKTKASWLVNMLNVPKNGEFVRARSEISFQVLNAPWWNTSEQKNLFALLCYGIFWGLDWSNQTGLQIKNQNNDSIFTFFNKYAGQKDPAVSQNAMCALKDALDASDISRFSESKYGTASRTNTSRYQAIAKEYGSFGALLQDPKAATMKELDNLAARGVNDVGWDLLPGNYERYLYQINANETSAGYWNIESADPNTMYGRFGRGFDIKNKKTALYFDLDDKFLHNAPLNGKYPIAIDIIYLDKGNGSFQVFYDSRKNANTATPKINLSNTNKWKKASIILSDAYFGNRGLNKSDFSIRSSSNTNVIFSIVEVSRRESNPKRKPRRPKRKMDASFQSSSLETTPGVSNLMIAPNPVVNSFVLSLPGNKETVQVQVFDLSGKPVYQNQMSGSQITISKHQIGNRSGTFFIRVVSPSKIYTEKIIVL